ncbi:radical SAM superfamily protein [Methanobrevibacter cuticularis]|uniref:Radical SAM superfamily protein n=1 Tax=Methanobrevibacter cuticularis TaxID=47311 RepID=A0A166CSK1_9EURY|nr:radical SAM protein [Methanobrevibacter cuticularis]KZX14818.1 radical SAM superfamily protein [Methanobrevibacter cuticularis]
MKQTHKKIKEITCKSACNKIKRSMPYKWDLNIYRGCEHSCIYCYALYSHKYLESNEFFSDIHVKTNIVEEFEKQLSRPSWKGELINIGGVTDSYQSIEEEYELMPKILQILIKYKNPAIISTKSDLPLRDIDLINELSEITYINIASSITSFDEDIRSAIEPNAISSQKRIAMIKKIRKETNASTGLHFMPIIPHVTDSYENIDSIFKNAKIANVHYVLPSVLNLFGKTRPYFYKSIKKDFPDSYDSVKSSYINGRVHKQYSRDLYKIINTIESKYSVSTSYIRPIKEKMKFYNKQENSNQSTLFDY